MDTSCISQNFFIKSSIYFVMIEMLLNKKIIMISVSIKNREVCNKVSVYPNVLSCVIHNNPVIHKTCPGRPSLLLHSLTALLQHHTQLCYFFLLFWLCHFIYYIRPIGLWNLGSSPVCVTDAPFNAVGATFKSVKPCQLSVIRWFTEAAGYAKRVGLNI